MQKDKKNKQKSPQQQVDSLFNTAHWILTALASTLVFLVFEMQAYTIPTGSMADTLRGAHFRLRCEQCAYRYDYDLVHQKYNLPPSRIPKTDVPIYPSPTRCPNCGHYMNHAQPTPVIAGDRIFVFKSIYQFFEPKRWDVVVFNDPLNPKIYYIKRLIGLPEETIEVIDGDVYVNNEIARKPKKVQEELWLPVFDNNYHPINPKSKRFNYHQWRQPFENIHDSKWDLGSDNPAIFVLDSTEPRIHTINYNTQIGNNFQATHAYDYPGKFGNRYKAMPICSDLMVHFNAKLSKSGGMVGANLSKYGVNYLATLDYGESKSKLILMKQDSPTGDSYVIAEKEIGEINYQEPVKFKFANVDHMLVLEVNQEKLTHDLGVYPDSAGTRKVHMMPTVQLTGTGKLEVYNLKILRDLHYISKAGSGIAIRQAGEGEPFALNKDEFFVMGDNTPASNDGRVWDRPGIGNEGTDYRQGTVPRDYMIGKAFVMFWPGAQKPFARFKLVPYLGNIKLIYGGSDENL